MIHAEMVHSGTVLGRVLAHASEVGRDQGSITVLAHVTEGEHEEETINTYKTMHVEFCLIMSDLGFPLGESSTLFKMV